MHGLQRVHREFNDNTFGIGAWSSRGGTVGLVIGHRESRGEGINGDHINIDRQLIVQLTSGQVPDTHIASSVGQQKRRPREKVYTTTESVCVCVCVWGGGGLITWVRTKVKRIRSENNAQNG